MARVLGLTSSSVGFTFHLILSLHYLLRGLRTLNSCCRELTVDHLSSAKTHGPSQPTHDDGKTAASFEIPKALEMTPNTQPTTPHNTTERTPSCPSAGHRRPGWWARRFAQSSLR